MRTPRTPKAEISKEAMILEALPGLNFRVRVKGVEGDVLAYLAGRMKQNHIRVLPGDKVLVVMSDDGERGRIVRRL